MAQGVDCLITVEQARGRSTVRVVGRFTSEQVPEFLQACGATGASPVTVDLTDLVSADTVGLRALRRVHADGASLAHVPRYLESLLDGSTRA